ncbi:MAG: HAD-IIB family hydrolase [Bacteriovoracaceae bacterium]
MNFKKPKVVFSDFDGTLTQGHVITPELFEILNHCHYQDADFVIHTGRSLSWGHCLLSHLPHLKSVITEGGGVYVTRDPKNGLMTEHFLVEKESYEKLEVVTQELLKKFPILELSRDSIGRITDRAIEKKDLLDLSVLKDVKAFLDEHEVTYSVSNVHLNFWCGEVDKYKALLKFIDREYDNVSEDDCWFFGDSLNDEPVFKDLKHTVGVHNLNLIKEEFKDLPSVILEDPEHTGPTGVLAFLKDNL